MARIDDLTILLTAVDKTKKAFKSAEGNLGALKKAAKLAAGALTAIGTAAAGAFTAAAANGEQLFDELNRMGKLLGITTIEADGLVNTIKEISPGAGIDQVQEALITLQEGFFDAHAESGPLFALIKDFGVNFNLNLDDPQAQLVDFLKGLQQLGSESDRVGAIVSNFGGEDAKPFLPLARDAEALRETIERLEGAVNSTFTQEDNDRLSAHRDSVNELTDAWKKFSQEAFVLIVDGLTAINNLLTKTTNLATSFVQKLKKVVETTSFIKTWRAFLSGEELPGLFGQDEADSAETLDQNDSNNNTVAPNGIKNEYGYFESVKAFERWYKEQEKLVTQAIRDVREVEGAERIRGFDSGSSGTAFLAELDAMAAGNDSRFNVSSGGDTQHQMDQKRRAETVESIGHITSALGAAGSAMGSFSQLAAANGAKSFKTFQRLQIAISTVAGISAQMQTLATVDNPTFLQKLAAYARMGAIVASGLASLKSVSIGGGGAAQTASASGSTAQTQAQGGNIQPEEETVRRNVTVNIQGNGTFTAEQLEDFIDTLNDTDTGTKINSNRIAA